VKTLLPFSRRRVGEHRATPHALDAHHAVTTHRECSGRELDGMGHPKAAILGQLAGLRSSGPLWPWDAVRPGGIVSFFNFLWIYSIQFQLKSPQICSNRVFE
jgi:hypothetical protein